MSRVSLFTETASEDGHGAEEGDHTQVPDDPGAEAHGLQVFHPHPLLADIVEDIWDWDIPNGASARCVTARLPPSAYALLVLQYRVPIAADWAFGDLHLRHSSCRHLAVKMQTGIVTLRPIGPIGSVIVRVKPEASERVTCVPPSEFLDQKIELHEIFNKHAIARIQEGLGRAPTAQARVALVENFLLREMRHIQPASQLMRAASYLRFNPSLSICDLASQLDISVRHLSRRFKATFGTGPKQFARLARVEKAVEARRDGLCWTDVAHACGFSDQAHLIHDFQAIIGVAPEAIFRPPGIKTISHVRTLRARLFFNLFVG